MFCTYNQINQLDNLPRNLINLICSNNNLLKLNNLPSKLKLLDCSYNPLVDLDNLPISLVGLVFNNTMINNLDYLPESMLFIEGSSKELVNIDNLPNSIKLLCLSNCDKLQNINCIPNKINHIIITNCNNLENIQGVPETIVTMSLINNTFLKNVTFEKTCEHLIELVCVITNHTYFNNQHKTETSINYPKSSALNLNYLFRTLKNFVFNNFFCYSLQYSAKTYHPLVLYEYKKQYLVSVLISEYIYKYDNEKYIWIIKLLCLCLAIVVEFIMMLHMCGMMCYWKFFEFYSYVKNNLFFNHIFIK